MVLDEIHITQATLVFWRITALVTVWVSLNSDKNINYINHEMCDLIERSNIIFHSHFKGPLEC